MNYTRTFTLGNGLRPSEKLRTATVEMVLDLDALALDLARKAIRNTSRKTRCFRGLVTARVHSIEAAP
jgi:hypothetical protein